MQPPLTGIIDEMQQRARTCETAAQDATQEALTGEASAKEKHTQAASEWTIKSQVWLEAAAVVQAFMETGLAARATDARPVAAMELPRV